MKNGSYLLTYLSSLVIGILLLVFHTESSLFEGIVIAIGILFIIPSAIMLVGSFISRKDADGNPLPRPWLEIISGILGLILGIWMAAAPAFFISFTVYTLGAILIILGLAGLVFLIVGSRPGTANPWWYITPVLTVLAGVVICVCGPTAVAGFAVILTGCMLICYAVNGLAALGREADRRRLRQ